MKENDVLYFHDPKDKETGWLSNQSYHSFVIAKKRWPTVEHYVQSQKFLDAELEEQIRCCETVFSVERFVNKHKHHVRPNWNYIKENVLKDAIKAKFTQNKRLKKLLIDTYPARLIDQRDNTTSRILEELRDKITPKPSEKYIIAVVPSTKDFIIDRLTHTDAKFIIKLFTVCKELMEKEGCKRIYGEMVMDSFALLFPKMKELYKTMLRMVIGPLRNFNKIMKGMHAFLKSREFLMHKHSKEEVVRVVVLFLRWHKYGATPQQVRYLSSCIEKDVVIVLAKGYRKYRSNSSIKENAETSADKEDDPKNQVQTKNSKSLEMIMTESAIIILGFNLKKHASELLEMGGKYPRINGEINTNQLVFDLESKLKLEAFIQSNLTQSELLENKISQRALEFLTFFKDIIIRLSIPKNYSNIVRICNLISEEDKTHPSYKITSNINEQLVSMELDEASLHFVKKRIAYLNKVSIPTDEEFIDNATIRLYEGLKGVANITKDQVFKVFLKNPDHETLAFKEEIRRAARVYKRVVNEPADPIVIIPPTPLKRKGRGSYIVPKVVIPEVKTFGAVAESNKYEADHFNKTTPRMNPIQNYEPPSVDVQYMLSNVKLNEARTYELMDEKDRVRKETAGNKILDVPDCQIETTKKDNDELEINTKR